MFWSRIAGVYDLIEKVYNGKCNERTTDFVASLMQQNDSVLECACGTGMFSVKIAPKVRRLTAMDFSEGMLKKARKKCRKQNNVLMQEGDITHLRYAENSFDKAVAANVIHLLDDPKAAISELERVVKPGGQIIIPTYVYEEDWAIRLFNKLGANYKRHFNEKTYEDFFKNMGVERVYFRTCQGRMPCKVAVFEKPEE